MKYYNALDIFNSRFAERGIDKTVPASIGNEWLNEFPIPPAKVAEYLDIELRLKSFYTEMKIHFSLYVDFPNRDALPSEFITLLKINSHANNLWNGKGKKIGDTSRTGYDMALLSVCIRNGITDEKLLSDILINSPEGAVQKSGKGADYIQRCVKKALSRCTLPK